MGLIYGTPGGSLSAVNTAAPSWAANREVVNIGASGERATAEVLNQWAAHADGTVLHDLSIPGSKANVDHAVLGASELLLIDTKVWRAGMLWTLLGRTYRGVEAFPSADKKTLPMAADRIQGALRNAGSKVTVRRVSLMVIHPSGASHPAALGLWAYRPSQARAIRASRLAGMLRLRAPRGRAEPLALSVLHPLLK